MCQRLDGVIPPPNIIPPRNVIWLAEVCPQGGNIIWGGRRYLDEIFRNFPFEILTKNAFFCVEHCHQYAI